MGIAQNGWFIRENPMKMDDLEVPPLMATPILHAQQPPIADSNINL